MADKTNGTKKADRKLTIKGSLIKCNRSAKEWRGVKGKEKLYITLAEVELTEEQNAIIADAFKDAGNKFTPDWVKEFEGYVNLSTIYELPCRSQVDGRDYESIEDYIADGFSWLGAEASISINVKDGALYPKAICIHTEGKEYNPFEDFDN